MSAIKREAFTLFLVLLFSSLLTATIPIKVAAQQEMTPEWTIENVNHFTKLAVSADGKLIAASTNKTDTLYLFHENELLWASPVDPVSSLAIADNGEYIAVGTNRRFCLFTHGNPTPRIDSKLDGDNTLVAISASGNTTAVGATSHTNTDQNTTCLCLFEKETLTPIWNTTLPGVLDSLSMSGDGNSFVASTSYPGILYLFSSNEATPLWVYNLGERSGGARISNDGSHIVATGGNQTRDKDIRIFQFQRQTAVPRYMKAISERPSFAGLSISADGSIFAMSYANSLMFFNLDLPPYGYGPGSVLKATLPSRRASMTMSSDGHHIIVGTDAGIFAYEYSDHQLTLRKQHTANKPRIIDVASSANGQFIIAATLARENREYSAIHFFENFAESQNPLVTLWGQLAILAIIVAVGSAVTIYVLRRGRKSRDIGV